MNEKKKEKLSRRVGNRKMTVRDNVKKEKVEKIKVHYVTKLLHMQVVSLQEY